MAKKNSPTPLNFRLMKETKNTQKVSPSYIDRFFISDFYQTGSATWQVPYKPISRVISEDEK